MASRFTFNSESMVFEEVKKHSNDYFDIGMISFLPRECLLADGENLGDKSPYDKEEESDLDEEEENEDNENTAFFDETKKTIERCVKNKFPISSAIMEFKSLKSAYNMDYSECIEGSFPHLLDTILEMEGDNAG